MDLTESKNRLQEANKILVEDSTSAEKLQSLSLILKGFNPKLDKALKNCSQNFSRLENLQSGDVISLTSQSLPEQTEDEKKRKKAIIAFIRTWADLKKEVRRIQTELNNSNSPQQQAQSAGRIIAFAKGPLGIVTIAAVLIVGFLAFTNLNKVPPAQDAHQSSYQSGTASASKIKGIIVSGKKIPLTELMVGQGPECDQAQHYHALNHTSAKALDGSNVPDPGGCGFGKVSEVKVVDLE